MSAGGGSSEAGGEDVAPDADLQRVKVYRLQPDGGWEDKGQGIITLQHLEQANAMGLVVCAEEPPHHTLLVHRLSRDISYEQQSGSAGEPFTILVWKDGEAHTDIAISFQEAAGCNHMWHQIQAEQGRANGGLGGGLRRHMVDEKEPSAGPHEADLAEERMGNGGPVELPPPELKHLEQIAKVLAEVSSMHQREQLAGRMQRDGYVRRLLDVFRAAEDLEDEASLRLLFEIVKSAIMLNDTSLLELLFSEENVMDMVGALEYDPELPERQRHRAFLRDSVAFREVVPLRSAAIKAKIHCSYRMGYVKDCALPRALDDGTFATLSSLIMFNNVEVVLGLMDEPDFLPDLFRKFAAAPPGGEARAQCVCFLQELTALAKSLQPSHRSALHQKLVQLGLFEAVAAVMQGGDQALQLKASDVLLAAVQHDPGSLRDFLLQERSAAGPGGGAGAGGGGGQNLLFRHLVQLLTAGAGGGLQEQVTEILRALLDPESMAQSAEENGFLDQFYDVYIDQLVGVIEAGTSKTQAPGRGPAPAALGLIVEILCFCAAHHGYRIKRYVLTHGTMQRVLRLLGRRERWLRCAAVRFVRTILGLKDEFYVREMVKVNLFEPIIAAFCANGPRYNLLNSAVLELFDFVRKQGMKAVMRDFMDRHYAKVADVAAYDPTFAKLRDRWEQMREPGSRETVAASEQMHAQRIRKDERALDRDEEDYFREGDGDDDEPAQPAAAASSAAAGGGHANGVIQGLQMDMPLVDYADDDEEEAPPPCAPGFKRQGGPPEPDSPQEKRGRFGGGAGGAPHDAHDRLGFAASPPLLKQPGADGMDWRRG